MFKRLSPSIVSFFVLALINLCPSAAFAQTVREDLWVTNGTVYDAKAVGDTLYVGGQFDYVGPATGSFGVAAARTGVVEAGWPKIKGTVKTVVPDGMGGWYVGGKFSSVGGVAIYNLAHIKADKSVDTNWNPNVSRAQHDDVKDMEAAGGVLYVGGSFTQIGGQSRKGLAAVDLATGAATNWNPTPSGAVFEIEIIGGRIYVGGAITAIGLSGRSGAAAFDLATGALLDWKPVMTWNTNNIFAGVNAFASSGNTVYLGGLFTSVSGQARNGLAAVDAVTGALLPWNPNPQDESGARVEALAMSGSTIYVGGKFLEIGGLGVKHLAAVDASTGVVSPGWTPNPGINEGEFIDHRGPYVSSIVMSDGVLYAAGAFRRIGGAARRGLAALDTATGAATSFEANTNDVVNDLAVEGGQAAAGGDFKSMGGVRRRNLAAFNLTTGRATDWNPDTESSSTLYSVKALATDGGATLYVAGNFERIGGRARKGLAEVNRTTGAVTDWVYSTSSIPPSNVSDLEVTPTTLYVAGGFTIYRGTTQLNHLVGIKRTTGALADFAPQPDSSVADMEISDGVLYVGGAFRNIAGQQRIHAASFDLATGALRAWKTGLDPASNAHHTGVSALAVANGKVYLGGHLPETIESPSPGAPPVTYGYSTLAAFNVSDGRLFSSWHPRPNFRVREIEVVGATCYIGGAFWEVGTDSQPQFAAAAVHSETGALADWKLFERSEYSSGEGLVEKFIVKDGLVYVVGAFKDLKGSGHSYVAGVTTPVVANVNPTVSLSVTINGTTTAAPSSVAVQANTSVSFAANAADVDGGVMKVDFYSGTTLLGTAASSPYTLTTAQLAAGEYMIKAVVTDNRGGTGESAIIRLTVLQPEQKLSINGRVVDQDGVGLVGVTLSLRGARNATTLTDADGRYAFNDLTPGAAYALTPVIVGYDFQPEGYRYASLGANEDASFVAYRETSSHEYSSNLWIPNGAVRASVVRGDTLYIGGDFTSLRGIGEHGAVVSTVTGAADQRFGKINGKIYAAVPDGAGGWYVGGTFTSARGLEGDVARRNLAHLLPDGTLDETWNPAANGKVNALVLVGTTLYVGGSFTEIAGGARKGLAALNGATGALTSWDAQLAMASQRTGLPLTVNALLVSDGRLFVGGVFDTAGGGVERGNVAQFNLTTGSLTEWEIGAKALGEVRSLALSAETGTLYISGIVFFPGESQGKYFAVVDAETGARRVGFNPPEPGGYIHSMAVVGNNLYVAGDFSGFREIVGGQTVTYFRKGGVALLDATTGAIKDWNPLLLHGGNTGASGSVLLAAGSTIYVGGGFTHAGGEGSVPATASQTRTGLAAYDASTGALTSWNPLTGGNVTAFALNGTSLFVGSSPATKGIGRRHLAAIDINTGQPTDWNPDADGAVHDLALGDTTIFVAGRFKNIGGAQHRKVAEVELTTGRVTQWNPSANLDNFTDPPPVGFEPAPEPRVKINEIAVAGRLVLLGGKFHSPDTDLNRPALIAVSRASGQVLNWDAGFAAGSEVREMLVDGDTVYVGGKFTAVGGQARANLAALNIGTAEVNVWSPSVTSAGNASGAHVAALAIAGGSIYIGGDFGEVGGQAHRDLAEVSLQTAQPTLWNPDVKPLTAGNPAYVDSVSITGSLVYAGGSFRYVGDAERHGLAAIDRTTGLASIWNPQVSGGDVLTIMTSTFGSKIFMGGTFTGALGLGANRAYLIGVRNPDPLSHNLVPKVDISIIQGIIQSGIAMKSDDGSSSMEPMFEADPLYRVELNADASDSDGQVTRVEFYNGVTLLGTDTAAPFSFDWNNVAAGTYTVTARAIDNKGASTTSEPQLVKVEGAAQVYAIAGQLTTNGSPLAGVSVILGGARSAETKTGADGRYAFKGLPAGGDYTVSLALANYTIAPGSRTFNNLSENQTADFTASVVAASLKFASAGYAVREGVGSAVITIMRSINTSTAVSVGYSTADGSAIGGSDYTATSGVLNFAAGETSKTVSVPISDDSTVEGVETFNITLGGLTGVALVGSPSFTTVTIADNDSCSYRLSQSASESHAAGGSVTVDVTAPAGCAWTAASNSRFISLTSGAAGSGNGSITFSVAANTSSQPRNGTLTIAGDTYTVTQAGATCDFAISSASRSFGAAGGAGSVNLTTAGADCVWETASDVSWITINSGTRGSGSGTVNFSVAANTGSQPRSATLLIAGRTLTVTQAGIACSYTVDQQTPAELTAAGGQGGFRMVAPQGCGWTVSSLVPWITITSGSSGTGTGSVTFTVAANIGAARTGQILRTDDSFVNVTQAGASATVRIESPTITASEGAGRIEVKVVREGDPSAPVSVDYRTEDTDTFTVGCADAAAAAGHAYARCDFATAVGTISFAVGETSKTVTIPVIDDAHVEGRETFQLRLSNVSGATLGATGVTTVTIRDNDTAGAQSPVMTHPFFVRQQYLDFLSREPDTNGFNAWLGLLNGCSSAFNGPTTASGCDRIFVSGEGFFRSVEFQLKGFYVFRFYKVGVDRLPDYLEVVSDMSFVAGQTADEVYARKAQLATLFTQRQEFQNLYGGMTNAQYVNALLARYQLTQVTTPDPAQPDGGTKVTLTAAELTNRLNANTLSRAQVLRAVADSDAVSIAEFNNAFVAMQYYGYLRRKPDQAGFNAWLDVLRSGDVRTMVNGFLNSTEYKLRFGQP